jgi:hypothetical protein
VSEDTPYRPQLIPVHYTNVFASGTPKTMIINVNPSGGYEGVCFSLLDFELDDNKTYVLKFDLSNNVTSFYDEYSWGFAVTNQKYINYETAPPLTNIIKTTATASYEQTVSGSTGKYLTFFLSDAETRGMITLKHISVEEVGE